MKHDAGRSVFLPILSTVFVSIAPRAPIGQKTDMSREVLDRINQRLTVLKLSESAASKAAGLSDSAIRNVRRKLDEGLDAKFSVRTIEKLAPTLRTSAAWLISGEGDPDAIDTPAANEIRAIAPLLSGRDAQILLAIAQVLVSLSEKGREQHLEEPEEDRG